MRVALLILLLSVICGCPTHRPPPEIEKGEPRNDRQATEARARVHLEQGRDPIDPANPRSDLEWFLAGAVGRGLVGKGREEEIRPSLAAGWRREPSRGLGHSWTFRIRPDARFSDGTNVRPEDVIRSWESARRSEGSPARWLLEPVEGLEARGGDLELRLTRPVPDLLERLAHPALAVWRIPPRGTPEGAGPFHILPGEARADANLRCMDGRPLLEGIDLVETGGADPSLLLRLREVDLAVVYGRSASGLLRGELDGYTLRRLPSWDRTYALWLNADPLNRWTRDPSFRRWLSGRIDREAMVDYLFASQGEPARGLIDGERPEDRNAPGWKVPPATRPRLTLTFDGDDAHAASLAARIKADLDHAGLSVGLDPAEAEELHRRLRTGRVHAALLLHRPLTSDPVLALGETLGGVGGAGDAVRALEEGSLEEAGTPAREEAAGEAQRLLLEDHRLVPLVRIHAWLVTDRDLVDVEVGFSGALGMERAAWRP